MMPSLTAAGCRPHGGVLTHMATAAWCVRALLGIGLPLMGGGIARSADDPVAAVRAATAWAQPGQWQLFTGNPVLAPGPAGSWDAGALGSMTVLQVGAVFHLYYEAWGVRGHLAADYKTLQIGHATSPDGVHWTKDPANPVLRMGTGDEWDKDGTWDPFVLHENGVFKMWYGGGIDRHCNWGYAVSNDGVHFEKKGQLSHLHALEDDHVIHDPRSGHYFMYYWDGDHEPAGLYCAESPDETSFDFAHANALHIDGLDPQIFYKFTHVIQHDGQWVMFFGKGDDPCKNCWTGMATSPDGQHWTVKNTHLVKGIDGEMLKVTDDLWLLFYGKDGYFDRPHQDIRLAVFKGSLQEIAAKKEP